MKRTKRVFTPEYKAEAVKLWEDSGKNSKEISKQLGITPQMLRRWQVEKTSPARCLITQATGSSSPTAAELAAENLRLRKENARLKMEHEILKKTVGIISEMHK
jgi:transposase